MGKTLKGKKFCSPKTKTTKKVNTCYSRKQLLQMTKKWNKQNKKKIKVKSSKKVLWDSLNNKLNKQCKTEWCWNKQLLNLPGIFRPDMPSKWKKNPREWLDSNNIINVMKQYERDRDDFTFIGPVPIDFDLQNKEGQCLVDDLCKVEVEPLFHNNKTKIGIIFNLDKHNETGSHWTALFIDTERKGLFYFDSYGYPPEEEIVALMDKIQHQYKQMNIVLKKQINGIRHQYKYSECGMYCINFIIKMLTTKTTFKRFCKNIIDDDTIFGYRKKYFLV
tara:strand:- start:228 stop:1055 length:828 start_codon:yes stop_codon:yes gene_type:complete